MDGLGTEAFNDGKIFMGTFNSSFKVSKNGKKRMMIEIIDGAIQVDPHTINGISQTPANGFDKMWTNWNDINAMVDIVKKHLGKNIV